MASGSPKSQPPKSQLPKFQAPKGTRDFYPQDLAVRRYIEGVWRSVSVNHGFDEIDGPTIEHLDLYTHKSGPGIASELFQVFSGKDEEQVAAMRAGGLAPYALRPEFTPTLARMVAAKANSLPMPVKWFAIPSHFRAERPQRGRLREFMQWNVDFLGDDSPRADAEVIATAVAALEKFGLRPENAKVYLNSRHYMEAMAKRAELDSMKYESLMWVTDNYDKIPKDRLEAEFTTRGITNEDVEKWKAWRQLTNDVFNDDSLSPNEKATKIGISNDLIVSVLQVRLELDHMGMQKWHESEADIVRGIAYYTGTVFEIIADGERAIAGGGRYDKLIESFGGPPMPACGFGMGDVVLANILNDKGLLKSDMEYLPRPHAFVIAANDEAAANLPGIVSRLRRKGFHVRHSYKPTRHVGKLLGDANKARALTAIILGDKLNENIVELKDLASGEQRDIVLDQLPEALRPIIDRAALDSAS